MAGILLKATLRITAPDAAHNTNQPIPRATPSAEALSPLRIKVLIIFNIRLSLRYNSLAIVLIFISLAEYVRKHIQRVTPADLASQST